MTFLDEYKTLTTDLCFAEDPGEVASVQENDEIIDRLDDIWDNHLTDEEKRALGIWVQGGAQDVA